MDSRPGALLMHSWPEYFQVRMTSLGSNPIVRWGASFGYLPPDTLSSSSSSCPPLSYRFGRLSPQSSHMMAGILHQMCQSVLKLLFLSLVFSHGLNKKLFCLIPLKWQIVMLDTCSKGCVPLAPQTLVWTLLLPAEPTAQTIAFTAFSVSPAPETVHDINTRESHKPVTKLLYYLDSYMKCNGKR